MSHGSEIKKTMIYRILSSHSRTSNHWTPPDIFSGRTKWVSYVSYFIDKRCVPDVVV